MSDAPISVGDLVVILKSDTFPQCIGWHVLVVREAEHDDFGRIVYIEHPPLPWAGSFIGETKIPADWLRRIPPLEELEGVDEREELHA